MLSRSNFHINISSRLKISVLAYTKSQLLLLLRSLTVKMSSLSQSLRSLPFKMSSLCQSRRRSPFLSSSRPFPLRKIYLSGVACSGKTTACQEYLEYRADYLEFRALEYFPPNDVKRRKIEDVDILPSNIDAELIELIKATPK